MLSHMQGVKAIARLALDSVLPPTCAKCRVVVERNGTVCADCWSGLRFISTPLCEACGFPFEYDGAALEAGHSAAIAGAYCADCLARPKAFERARAALAYDDASRDLILAFKHADRTETSVTLATWMALAGRDLLGDADIILPVPLHWRRLFLRRYNQSALLAQKLAERQGKVFSSKVLQRRRATRTQGRLSGAARRRNVAGAFRIKPSARHLIEGRRVLLIDDVYTTGATVDACVSCLLNGGAAAVDVLTLARVVRT